GAEPAAKGVARTVAAKAGDVFCNGSENFLKDVRSVFRRQLGPFAPVIDQWGVQIDESFPRPGLVGLDAQQQAGRGGSGRGRPGRAAVRLRWHKAGRLKDRRTF